MQINGLINRPAHMTVFLYCGPLCIVVEGLRAVAWNVCRLEGEGQAHISVRNTLVAQEVYHAWGYGAWCAFN